MIGQHNLAVISGTEYDALFGLDLHQITSYILDLVHKGQFGLIML